AEPPPSLFAAFDNESRRVAVETIGVRPNPALGRFLEHEAEGVEYLMRAEPNILVGAMVDGGPKDVDCRLPDFAVRTITANDKVSAEGRNVGGLGLGLETKIDTQFDAAFLEDVQEALAGDPDKTVSA